MYKIIDLKAIEILDSRGNPTIEVELTLEKAKGRAITPSGASTGIHEALELRDGDKTRYLGKGVLKAVNNVNTTIKNAVIGKIFSNYREFDNFLIKLDGTKNKSNLGANAVLACSMAFVCACADSEGKQLYNYLGEGKGYIQPIPLMNIINGGEHADNSLDFQEFMIVPVGFNSIKERVRVGAEIFHNLKSILKSKGLNTAVGDEGGFAPDFKSNKEGIETVIEAIKKAGYTTEQVKISLDVAASEFYKDGKYILKSEGRDLSSSKLIDYYEEMVNSYPIFSIEDGMAEDDFEGWAELNNRLGNRVKLVGDDLFVTNIERIQLGIEKSLANAILIKLNQIGTVSETLDAINLGKKHDMISIISHRSGETEDTFIADLAVAVNSGYIKTGSLSRTDRIAKYNRLIRIEELQK
ncbi:MAG: phosphopyruvate hydratase [Candidatus Gracilibacteria bacterium]|nr:phosphopyruvate hydratase [Candidatus Gracilibacteria bacterium]